ncbi:MAG: SDR family oxidoreductase [Actinobacteria bacterium]|nr:SDR family oxidoreductase [Actinomycetota bacterium]
MSDTRKVAIVGEANSYSGPAIALEMARRGYDLVLGDAQPGLVAEVTALGARAVDCIEVPYHFLRAIVPVMVERGSGQVLVQTSASGARVTPGAPLYSTARAAANHLVKNVAAEVAGSGVQVNAVGTNFMDFPGFLDASGVKDAESRARVEAQVPMKKLGSIEEFASFCANFIDGSFTFTTGQFVSFSGGWS